MVSASERRRQLEAPEMLRKDADGNTIYPRTIEGTAGDSFTFDERRDVDLPAPHRDYDNDNISDINERPEDSSGLLMAGAAAGAAAIAAENRLGAKQPATLPPYVQTQKEGDITIYTFVAPPQAREVGFEPSILLGRDDGSGNGMAGINERAWALAGQMEVLMKRHAEKIIRDNPTVATPDLDRHPRRQGPFDPTDVPLFVVGYAASDNLLARDIQNQHEEDIARANVVPSAEPDIRDEVPDMSRANEQMNNQANAEMSSTPAAAAPVVPLPSDNVHRHQDEQNRRLAFRPKSEAPVVPEPEPPQPK